MRMVGDFFEIFNIYIFLFWGGGQNNQKGRWGEVLSSSLKTDLRDTNSIFLINCLLLTHIQTLSL